jgi:DNA-3-methyladenine glycosylase II
VRRHSTQDFPRTHSIIETGVARCTTSRADIAQHHKTTPGTLTDNRPMIAQVDQPLADSAHPCSWNIPYTHPMPHLRQRPRAPRYDSAQAIRHLAAVDPRLARLIRRAGPFTMKLASAQSPFEALLESIIYQQLHGKAAATIHARLLASFAQPGPGGDLLHPVPHPTAQHLLDAPNEQMRAAGLSHNKALAIRDLAAKTLDGTIPSLARIRRMSDEAIVEHLTQVRGIGRWTVQMMLIFRLGRPDVLPTNDYGIRKGFALTFGKLKPSASGVQARVTPADLPRPADMEKRARKWHPWCSVASWYLWRACDLAVVAGQSDNT